MEGRLLMMVLRVVHILGGVFWLGATLVIAGFLLPAMRATGGESPRFLNYVMQERRMQMYLSIAMVLTILSGLAMFGYLSSAGGGAWARSRMATVLSIGAVLSIVASAAASMFARPAGRKVGVIAQRMQAARSAGAAPSPADVAEVQALQARIANTLTLVATLLVFSAAAMAIARYA